MPKAKPIAKFRAGALTSSVWENTGTKEDGTEFEFHTIQLQRSYKDEGNEKANKDGWVTETINLRKNDVANMVIVVKKAHQRIVLKTE
jgi:hypothetical protein